MRLLIRRLAVPSIVLAACVAGPAHAQPTDATALSGRWTGSYDCAQGATSLDLSLRGNAHGLVHGTFRFGGTGENPGLPAGAYPVMGRLTGTSLVLRPIDPRDLPPDYVPVGIQATVSGPRLTGWIEGPGCGAVAATRAEPARPDAPVEGGYGRQRWATVLEVDEGRLSMDAREPDATAVSVRRAWMRWETLRDDAASGQRAGQATELDVEMDCQAPLMRVWHMLVRGADGELASFDALSPHGWAPIEDGTIFDRVWEHACFGLELPGEEA